MPQFVGQQQNEQRKKLVGEPTNDRIKVKAIELPVAPRSQKPSHQTLENTWRERLSGQAEVRNVFFHGTSKTSAGQLQLGIDVEKSKKNRDFGRRGSFYLHPGNQLRQAVEMTQRVTDANNCFAVVVYLFPDKWENDMEGWKIESPTDEWKKLVADSRQDMRTDETKRADNLQYVFGPIAGGYPPIAREAYAKKNENGKPLFQLAVKRRGANYVSKTLHEVWWWCNELQADATALVHLPVIKKIKKEM